MLSRRALVPSSALFVVASMWAGAACKHDREEPPAPIEAPTPDVGIITDAGQLPLTVLVGSEDQEPDFSCLNASRPDAGPIFPPEAGADAADEAGTDDATTDAVAVDSTPSADGASDAEPPIGTIVPERVELIGFGTGGADKLGEQTVDVFYNNTFKSAPDLTVMSDKDGLMTVPLPYGLRVGYRVRKSMLLGDYYGLDDLHVPLPPSPITRWQGVTIATQETLALAITGTKGYEFKPGTGIIAGRVLDCRRRNVQHARIVLLDYTDNEAAPIERQFAKCGEGLCLSYLSDNELPDIGRTATSRSSLFSMIDVPAGRKLRLVARGVRVAGGAPEDVAWRNLEVKESAIATHMLEPNAPKAVPQP